MIKRNFMKKNILNEEISRIRNMMRKLMNEQFDDTDVQEINFPQSFGGSRDDFDSKKDIRDLSTDWQSFKSRRENDIENVEKLKRGAKIYGYRSRGEFGDEFGISRTVVAFDKDEAIKRLKMDFVDYDDLIGVEDIDSESYGKKRIEKLKNLVIDPSKVEDVTSLYLSDFLRTVNKQSGVEDDFNDYQYDAYASRYNKDW